MENVQRWGVRVKVYGDHLTCTHYFNNTQVPPVPCGPRGGMGLTPKAVTKIRRGVASLEAQGQTWFVTLTYPNALPGAEVLAGRPGLINVVDDAEAKRHLSVWLRRVKRAWSQFSYVWVAEVQPERYLKRGERAIHFHLVTNMALPLEWLNESWSDVVGRGKAFPNQQRVKRSAGAYMAKYMTKGAKRLEEMTADEINLSYIAGNRYGMDHAISARLKARSWAQFPSGDWFKIATSIVPDDVPFTLNSDKEFLAIHWGWSYLKGNGNARNHSERIGDNPNEFGPLHSLQRSLGN